jgi:hypothetical protein
MSKSAKKAPVKMLVPDNQRCEMMDNKDRRCERRHEYRMTRTDETETRLCRLCAYKERDQRQHHPDYFDTVHFIAINRYVPVG